MSVSLSEFFFLENELEALSSCLCYTSEKCKKLAWFGDILQSTILAKLWTSDSDHMTIGEFTKKKALYVSNTTMRKFMTEHTDAQKRLQKRLQNANQISVHTYGTVFEALLQSCERINGNQQAELCVVKYCTWVEANITKFNITSNLVEVSIFKESFGVAKITCEIPTNEEHFSQALNAKIDVSIIELELEHDRYLQ